MLGKTAPGQLAPINDATFQSRDVSSSSFYSSLGSPLFIIVQ